ncbi:hypothetical protein K443DRAFT_7220 [Laccaria amethystina LaAM-08-1]|uniref:Uncharacterized protein n=1 Tax=Laccaria amethystina LaAM-08-1 TaxID=1095629 RepID=A0A0C9XZ62_9AGAR|nr:hypothetical protein K443DRAFT_7220 [Laccaria amethystina LaAM-08-1]
MDEWLPPSTERLPPSLNERLPLSRTVSPRRTASSLNEPPLSTTLDEQSPLSENNLSRQTASVDKRPL